jgi:hypothetical protein
MSVRPAGAVPSTGAPQASYPAGTYDFETHILIVGANPIINRGAFPGRLSETIREIVPGATSFASSNAIVKGSQTTVLLPAPLAFRLARPAFIAVATITAANIGAVLGSPAGSLPAAATAGLIAAIMAGSSAYRVTETIGTFPVKAHWITITGRLGATATWTTANLNRAIARAFANNVAWQDVAPAYGNDFLHPFPAPNDGNPLLDALNDSDACTGGHDYEKVYAAACTRVALATAVTTLGPSAQGAGDYMKPTSQGTANYTKPSTTTGGSTPVSTGSSQDSSIQRQPSMPDIIPPAPSAPPPAPSRTGTYVAVGLGAAAIGVMWWQRKAIFG